MLNSRTAVAFALSPRPRRSSDTRSISAPVRVSQEFPDVKEHKELVDACTARGWRLCRRLHLDQLILMALRVLACLAIGAARADVVEGRLLPVPVHLRDRHYGGAQRLDGHHVHLGVGGLERLAGTGDRAAGADPRDDRVDVVP